MTEEEKMDKKLAEMETRRIKQYLIDREGKIHKYKGTEWKSSLHDAIAGELFPGVPLPGDLVNKLGWVVVGNSKWVNPVCRKNLTQAQINTLDRLRLFDATRII